MINQENIDFLFDVMKFYDEQCTKIADNCFEEINRALNEIASNYLKQQNVKVLPFGAFALKNNYQFLEPMEFYVVIPASNEILEKERQQKLQALKKKRKSAKDIYSNIVADSASKQMTAIDVASVIMRELQKYLDESDKVYYKNNVVFVKFNLNEENSITINIFVGYDIKQDGNIELTKLGYKIKENPVEILRQIQQKNLETNGNYLLLCKLLKMLELELVLNKKSNVYLSNKTLFVENILYNIPNKFYNSKDFCEIFKNIINYLKNCDIEDIFIPGMHTEPMFIDYSFYNAKQFKSFIKKLEYLYKNTDIMIADALKNADNKIENDNTMQNDTDVDNEDIKVTKINKNIDKDSNN